jgi:hypothetical protein
MVDNPLTCPCCGYITDVYGEYEPCDICGWEYDIAQHQLPHLTGGSNGVSLAEAQQNFLRTGAVRAEALDRVRPVTAKHRRDPRWRPGVFNLGTDRRSPG